MFEKVNKYHPDKIADRISGAIVDLGFKINSKCIIAVECLLGHGSCNVIVESNVKFKKLQIKEIINRISPVKLRLNLKQVSQDIELNKNQTEIHTGDNGIFKGLPISNEEKELIIISNNLEEKYKSDGKYIIADDTLIICQSNANKKELETDVEDARSNIIINPLGFWKGGSDVDSGACNRKLGSDMGFAITGGGINGKDCTKADVSVNLYCFALAQRLNTEVTAYCSIGSSSVKIFYNNNFVIKPFIEIYEYAIKAINEIGGYEKLSEYGFLRNDYDKLVNII